MITAIDLVMTTCAKRDARGELGFAHAFSTLAIVNAREARLVIHEEQIPIWEREVDRLETKLPTYSFVPHRLARDSEGRFPYGRLRKLQSNARSGLLHVSDIWLDDDAESCAILDEPCLIEYQGQKVPRDEWAQQHHGVRLFSQLDASVRNRFFERYGFAQSYAHTASPVELTDRLIQLANEAERRGFPFYRAGTKSRLNHGARIDPVAVASWSGFLGTFNHSPRPFNPLATQCEDWEAADDLIRMNDRLVILANPQIVVPMEIKAIKYAPGGIDHLDRVRALKAIMSRPNFHGQAIWKLMNNARMNDAMTTKVPAPTINQKLLTELRGSDAKCPSAISNTRSVVRAAARLALGSTNLVRRSPDVRLPFMRADSRSGRSVRLATDSE